MVKVARNKALKYFCIDAAFKFGFQHAFDVGAPGF